ncbi:phage terminase small subunit P27 family [Streptococcus parauberis]|uniref:phage terminase small subunit P27 family n=1 Tax=Streptococcus parauberis TaxID=1348 RepID=UPI000C155D8F|nr:phage terminase small subunit P27 family [Streptococcus parauberis]PIA83674.1 Phage terminase, small subunit [Streptococcus parauberis]
MTKKPYYQQNDGHLPKDPPKFFGAVAGECYRKIVPFLESTNKVNRIDVHLVEMYCTNYEIYREAYLDIRENGIQQNLTKPIQAQGSGEILGEQFLGYKKNPAVATMKDANTQLLAIGTALGLSPKARQELMAIASEDKNEKSTAELMKEFLDK